MGGQVSFLGSIWLDLASALGAVCQGWAPISLTAGQQDTLPVVLKLEGAWESPEELQIFSLLSRKSSTGAEIMGQ